MGPAPHQRRAAPCPELCLPRAGSRGRGACPEPCRGGGFTLTEMLVVMAIAAVMGTLTIVSFAAVGRRGAREGAAQDVSGVLRQARLSAVDSGLGAVVRINPADRTIYGLSRKVEAAWHFEEVDANGITPGARRMDGTVMNGATVQPGTVGLCLEFDGTDQYVDCDQYPIYDQTDGIRLEAYVRPERLDPESILGVMGKSDATGGYSLGLARLPGPAETYQVHGGFYFRDDDDNDLFLHLCSYNPVTGEGVTLAGSQWHHLALEFDGFEARLLVDGVLVDLDSYRFPEHAPPAPDVANPLEDPNPGPPPGTDRGFSRPARILPARGERLEIGRAYIDCPGGTGVFYFQGRIDEPQILSVAGGRRVTLPEGVPIVTSDEAIYFDGQGYLDLAHHTGGAYVAVGDPYQAAELASDNGTTIDLRVKNPFPPTGGLVMLWNEIIEYSSAVGLTLTVATDGWGNPKRYAYSGDASDTQVRFARVVRIGQTGIVERVERMMP